MRRRTRRRRRRQAGQRFRLDDRRRRYLFDRVRRLAGRWLLHRLTVRDRQLLLQLADQLQLKHLLMLQRVQGALQQRQVLERSLGVGATGQRRRRELCDRHLRVLKGFQGDVTSPSGWEQAGGGATLYEIVVVLRVLSVMHLLARSFLVVLLLVLIVHAFLFVLLQTVLLILVVLVALMRPRCREVHGLVSASSSTATLLPIRRKVIFLSCNTDVAMPPLAFLLSLRSSTIDFPLFPFFFSKFNQDILNFYLYFYRGNANPNVSRQIVQYFSAIAKKERRKSPFELRVASCV